MDSDEEEDKETTKPSKFPIQMYISEGNKHLRLAKYDTAIEFFNTALEREPSNEKCLIGRSKCHMRLAKFSEAKRDAEEALKAHPKSCDAKMLIGEADYFLGDFEKAFLTFYRGYAIRKNHEGLKCGYQMCRKAIDNALHPDEPMTIDDQDIENFSRLKDDLENEQLRVSKIRKGLFTSDLDFVNKLLKDDTTESIHSHCEYLKSYLEDRQLFWKTQNPSTMKRSRNNLGVSVEKKKTEDDTNLVGSNAVVKEMSGDDDTVSSDKPVEINTSKEEISLKQHTESNDEAKSEEMEEEAGVISPEEKNISKEEISLKQLTQSNEETKSEKMEGEKGVISPEEKNISKEEASLKQPTQGNEETKSEEIEEEKGMISPDKKNIPKEEISLDQPTQNNEETKSEEMGREKGLTSPEET